MVDNQQYILLLGGFGFIGTNILKYIDNHKLGYRVITFDRYVQHPQGLTFDCVDRSYSGDFSDESIFKLIFSQNSIDIVVHCISTTVPVGIQSTRYDVESNLLPTIKLLDVMNSFGVFRIVFLSSGGAVYGDGRKIHSEEDAVFPKSSYGVVKVAIEKTLFQYAFTTGLKPLIIRLSNPYGRYHSSNRQGIVNIALKKAAKGEKLIVWGDGSATKDYIFIDDFCGMLFEMISKSVWMNVINVGSGYLYSVNDILNEVKKLFPGFSWEYHPANKTDVSYLCLNLDRLRTYTQIPPHKLEEILPILAGVSHD